MRAPNAWDGGPAFSGRELAGQQRELLSWGGGEFKAAPEFKVRHVDFLGPFSQWVPSIFGVESPSWADCPFPRQGLFSHLCPTSTPSSGCPGVTMFPHREPSKLNTVILTRFHVSTHASVTLQTGVLWLTVEDFLIQSVVSQNQKYGFFKKGITDRKTGPGEVGIPQAWHFQATLPVFFFLFVF